MSAEAGVLGDEAAVLEVEVGVDARVHYTVAVARVADVAAEDEDLAFGDVVALLVDDDGSVVLERPDDGQRHLAQGQVGEGRRLVVGAVLVLLLAST